MRFILALLLFSSSALAQTTSPARDTPSSVADGKIRFALPPGWTQTNELNEGATKMFSNESDLGSLTVLATRQSSPIPNTPANRSQLGPQIAKSIKQGQLAKGVEIIEEPKLQSDERFLVVIHDKVKSEGKTVEQLHLYKPVGSFLVMVAASSQSDDINTVRKTFREAQHVAESATTGALQDQRPAEVEPDLYEKLRHAEQATTRPARISTFGKAGLSILVPGSLTELRADTNEGLIATYHDKTVPTLRKITVRVKPLPTNSASDQVALEAAMKELFAADGLLVSENPNSRPNTAGKERKLTRSYEQNGLRYHVESQQKIVGEELIGVTCTYTGDDTDAAKVADALAVSIAPITPR